MCMCEALVFALGIVDKKWNLQLQQLVKMLLAKVLYYMGIIILTIIYYIQKLSSHPGPSYKFSCVGGGNDQSTFTSVLAKLINC